MKFKSQVHSVGRFQTVFSSLFLLTENALAVERFAYLESYTRVGE